MTLAASTDTSVKPFLYCNYDGWVCALQQVMVGVGSIPHYSASNWRDV